MSWFISFLKTSNYSLSLCYRKCAFLIAFIYRAFNEMFKIFKENLKKSTVKPSEPGLLLFFIFRSTFDIPSAVIRLQALTIQGCANYSKYLDNLYRFRCLVAHINLSKKFELLLKFLPVLIVLPFSCCTFGKLIRVPPSLKLHTL